MKYLTDDDIISQKQIDPLYALELKTKEDTLKTIRKQCEVIFYEMYYDDDFERSKYKKYQVDILFKANLNINACKIDLETYIGFREASYIQYLQKKSKGLIVIDIGGIRK